jgi:hypothetical protein
MTTPKTLDDVRAIEYCGLDYSNCDHVLPDGLEEALRAGKRGEHPAWEHFGHLWFEDGKFYEMVMRYRSVVGVYGADSLRELIDDVNERWGNG